MSSSIILRFIAVVQSMRDKSYKYKFSKNLMLISGCGLLTNLPYALITKDSHSIKVVEKYKYNTGGFTNFMVVDDYGRHYRVSNSVWYNKWDSIEDYSKIK